MMAFITHLKLPLQMDLIARLEQSINSRCCIVRDIGYRISISPAMTTSESVMI
jgi:hypothetical protein